MAFSGGTDNTLVLKVTHYVLGDQAGAMTVVSASLPVAERLEAVQIAMLIGAKDILVESDETSDPGLPIRNPFPHWKRVSFEPGTANIITQP